MEHEELAEPARRQFIEMLEPYYPQSDGYWRDLAVTVSGANNLPIQLLRLVSAADAYWADGELVPVESLPQGALDPEAVASVFTSCGSDKSTGHNYHYLYAAILSSLIGASNPRILEIGLGTNNPAVMSNMGPQGTPGASLRAWHRLIPHASVFGADVDRDILFAESGIATYFVDQLDSLSFGELYENCGGKNFNLVIDDGLHSPEANLNTLLFGLEAMTEDGWMVIEDISPRSLSIWRLVARLIVPRYQCAIVHCSQSFVFVVRHRTPGTSQCWTRW